MKFDCYYASYKLISPGPKMSLETNKSKKKAIFPVTKNFCLFVLVLSSVTNLRG